MCFDQVALAKVRIGDAADHYLQFILGPHCDIVLLQHDTLELLSSATVDTILFL